ncbi:MAG: hypothetical protein O3A84_10885 [Proteobacteria bacterium]|nr:hypothetical protein [Pseudomonadota bacterium]
MDTAIKAEWYDVDDADRESYLDWLHGRHLPALQSRPGYSWVGHYDRAPDTGRERKAGQPPRVETDDPNVGKGSQFLVVIAAASPDVFFDPNASQEADAETEAQLAKRKEYRSAVFVEETRVSGPDWYRHLPGSGAPPAIQLGNYQTRNEADDLDLAIWYRQMKLPQVTRARGCIGARKLVSVVGWPKHGILYEFMEMEPGEDNFEQRFRDAGLNERWTGRHVLEFVVHGPKGPHAGRRIWPPVEA